MPAIRAATISADDLAPVECVPKMAAFERVDERTFRAACERGDVPGAFKRGRSWRVVTAAYLERVAS